MSARLDNASLDQLFRAARTQNGWKSDPLPESTLRELYDLLKFTPTAANSSPARFVFVTSDEAKESSPRSPPETIRRRSRPRRPR